MPEYDPQRSRGRSEVDPDQPAPVDGLLGPAPDGDPAPAGSGAPAGGGSPVVKKAVAKKAVAKKAVVKKAVAKKAVAKEAVATSAETTAPPLTTTPADVLMPAPAPEPTDQQLTANEAGSPPPAAPKPELVEPALSVVDELNAVAADPTSVQAPVAAAAAPTGGPVRESVASSVPAPAAIATSGSGRVIAIVAVLGAIVTLLVLWLRRRAQR